MHSQGKTKITSKIPLRKQSMDGISVEFYSPEGKRALNADNLNDARIHEICRKISMFDPPVGI